MSKRPSPAELTVLSYVLSLADASRFRYSLKSVASVPLTRSENQYAAKLH